MLIFNNKNIKVESTKSSTRIYDRRTHMQKKPLTAKQTKALSKLLLDKPRDRALFHVGIDSMLRSSDLRFLTVDDVTDSQGLSGKSVVSLNRRPRRPLPLTSAR